MNRLTKKNKCKLSHGEEIVICKHSENDCNDLRGRENDV